FGGSEPIAGAWAGFSARDTQRGRVNRAESFLEWHGFAWDALDPGPRGGTFFRDRDLLPDDTVLIDAFINADQVTGFGCLVAGHQQRGATAIDIRQIDAVLRNRLTSRDLY